MHARTTPRIIVLALLSFELCHCNANVDSMTQEVKAASAYNAHRVMLDRHVDAFTSRMYCWFKRLAYCVTYMPTHAAVNAVTLSNDKKIIILRDLSFVQRKNNT